MKKSKSWIHVCVHFLLFISLRVHSATIQPYRETNDIDNKIPILKHNIPKDYKINVKYIPKEKAGMCWFKLNIYFLNKSLTNLTQKFGNISSNKEDIEIIIQYLQEVQMKIPVPTLEYQMSIFECHFTEDSWETEKFFDFVKNIFEEAKNENDSFDCDAPDCPTTSPTSPSLPTPVLTRRLPTRGPVTLGLSAVVEKSLFGLLFIPLLALIFLLLWKVRTRNPQRPQQNTEQEQEQFTEQTAPPQHVEPSETNTLNTAK